MIINKLLDFSQKKQSDQNVVSRWSDRFRYRMWTVHEMSYSFPVKRRSRQVKIMWSTPAKSWLKRLSWFHRFRLCIQVMSSLHLKYFGCFFFDGWNKVINPYRHKVITSPWEAAVQERVGQIAWPHLSCTPALQYIARVLPQMFGLWIFQNSSGLRVLHQMFGFPGSQLPEWIVAG
jgi:hypothetical protein